MNMMKLRSFRWWAKASLILLLSLLIILNVTAMICSGLGLHGQLNWLKGAVLEIETGSMAPKLNEGDLIFVWETPYEEIVPGDIVTYNHGENLVTHEVLSVNDDTLITKGIAADTEDDPVKREAYCAKMVFAMPGCGWMLDVFSSPVTLVILAFLIFFIFFGINIITGIYMKIARNRSVETRRPIAVRVVSSVALFSVCLLSPFMTAAKYTSDMNVYIHAVANAEYFKSNYLTPDGSSYEIHGWDGLNFTLPLEIRNFDNSLLFNKEGADVKYKFEITPVDDPLYAKYGEDYEINITPGGTYDTESGENGKVGYAIKYGENAEVGAEDYYVIHGNNDDCETHVFMLEVKAKDQEHGLPATRLYHNAEKDIDESITTEVKFSIFAYTTESEMYYKELMGNFTLAVAGSKTFLGATTLESSKGVTLLSYGIKTNQLEGSESNDVVITWDASYMYLNAYESTAMNIIQNGAGIYLPSVDMPNGRKQGFIRMTMQAFSSVNLQFFRYANFVDAEMAEAVGMAEGTYALLPEIVGSTNLEYAIGAVLADSEQFFCEPVVGEYMDGGVRHVTLKLSTNIRSRLDNAGFTVSWAGHASELTLDNVTVKHNSEDPVTYMRSAPYSGVELDDDAGKIEWPAERDDLESGKKGCQLYREFTFDFIAAEGATFDIADLEFNVSVNQAD